MLSVATEPIMLSVIMLSVIMLIAIMLSVVMLSVVMLNVVAPKKTWSPRRYKFFPAVIKTVG